MVRKNQNLAIFMFSAVFYLNKRSEWLTKSYFVWHLLSLWVFWIRISKRSDSSIRMIFTENKEWIAKIVKWSSASSIWMLQIGCKSEWWCPMSSIIDHEWINFPFLWVYFGDSKNLSETDNIVDSPNVELFCFPVDVGVLFFSFHC